MTPEEKAVLAGLPDPIPVFRGALVGVNESGWAWTLDRARAVWFAVEYSGLSPRVPRIQNRRPILFEAQVFKANVIGYLNDREEQEILAPPFRVEVLRTMTDLVVLAEASNPTAV